MNFKDLLIDVHKSGISDVHFHSKKRPSIRLADGDIALVDEHPVLSKGDIESIINEIANDSQKKMFNDEKELDFSFQLEGMGRYRANIFQEKEGPAIALRLISEYIPSLEELGLAEELKNLLMLDNGLVLITGPTGSGKTTTLASMVDFINKNRKLHIITIEDPIEFNFVDNKSLITQREVCSHTKNFAKAIRSSLREDPDVVMVGEMRDRETIEAALTLAETGHLVISTLHTTNAVQTIDRIIDVYPSDQQDQVKHQLANNLKGVISQILIPRKDDSTRVAAREIMFMNDGIKNCIIKGNNEQIFSMIDIGTAEGMVSLDQSLEALVRQGIVEKSIAIQKAIDCKSFEKRISDI